MYVRKYTAEPLYSGQLETRKDCPDYEDVLILEVEVVLWQSTKNHLVSLACVHNRGCPQFRVLE